MTDQCVTTKTAIAVIQPCVPHYREPFFAQLCRRYDCTIFCLSSPEQSRKAGFVVINDISSKQIGYRCLWRFAFFNPVPLLRRKYRVWVLMASPWQVSNWLLMALAPLLGRKTVLWGQGIDITHYLEYERSMPLSWKLMYRWCSYAWFYSEREKKIWSRLLPRLCSAALGNTLEYVATHLAPEHSVPDRDNQRAVLCKKFGVTTPFNFLFCARFDYRRRMDLLLEAVNRFDQNRFGFLIVGDGENKLDFSRYPNVYAFGAVFEQKKKNELFALADVYFQPAWLGLSVVEAMMHSLPVLTFSRVADRFHGVEYSYIAVAECGIVVEDVNELEQVVHNTTPEQWRAMGERGQKFYREKLTMAQMIDRACQSIDRLVEGKSTT